MKSVVLSLLFASVFGINQDAYSVFRTRNTPEEQANAAEGVIFRLLGAEKAQRFHVIINESISTDGKDTFWLMKDQGDDHVTIIGSNGLSITWGFHYYLKNYCNCHVSWDGDQLRLPDILPSVNIMKSSLDRFRYYQNVCTSSYSFVWWDWKRWEREIDWMALNGINLALAFTAQEAIWQRVYDGLGLPKNGFTGPAFLAWNRMGNLRNFGKGLTADWNAQSITLQHLILERMRSLDITPVLPAFSGIVPKVFKKKYPTASVANISKWNNFGDEYCCPYLLNPSDPMFSVISRIFLREYILEFGTNHVYNCDTFNENTPPSNDLAYLSSIAKSIYEGILQMDPQAVWMIQGWMFIHPFWAKEEVKAFVTSVPKGRMLVLDLQSDLTPQYEYFDSYYGQPFIWCTLHNFGGQLGLYGHLHLINNGIVKARNYENSTMIGVGITPEGIDQNYIIYQFTLEGALRPTAAVLNKWVSSYILGRYGIYNADLDQAWFILKETVYNYNPDAVKGLGKFMNNKSSYGVHISKNILTKRPSLSMNEVIWYNKSEMFEVFRKFLKASKMEEVAKSELFRHDFIDVTRQTVQLAIGCLYNQLMTRYFENDSENFEKVSIQFLELLDDVDVVLKTGKKFLLGKWLRDAKRLAKNDNETVQYEYNARNQITLWGPKGEIRDYAAKQWSGLISDYYKPRWDVFISALNLSLVENTKFNATLVRGKMFLEVEQPFTLATVVYPAEPQGDTIEEINNFNDKWNAELEEIFQNDEPIQVRS